MGLGLNVEKEQIQVAYYKMNHIRPNAGKYGPEKLQIRTHFKQCIMKRLFVTDNIYT